MRKNFSLKISLKTIFLSLCVVSLLSIGDASAQAKKSKLNSVCPKVIELGTWQYKNNSPVRSGSALTSSIVRFALNPTIIFTGSQGDPTRFDRAKAYDRSGELLLSAPRLTCAARKGTCLARYKANEATSNTRKMRRLAVKRSGTPEIFWKVSNQVCVRVPDIGQCYNVKKRDLCNGTTIK
jgi:hypothetical protein